MVQVREMKPYPWYPPSPPVCAGPPIPGHSHGSYMSYGSYKSYRIMSCRPSPSACHRTHRVAKWGEVPTNIPPVSESLL